jgi:hypothetical protein
MEIGEEKGRKRTAELAVVGFAAEGMAADTSGDAAADGAENAALTVWTVGLETLLAGESRAALGVLLRGELLVVWRILLLLVLRWGVLLLLLLVVVVRSSLALRRIDVLVAAVMTHGAGDKFEVDCWIQVPRTSRFVC